MLLIAFICLVFYFHTSRTAQDENAFKLVAIISFAYICWVIELMLELIQVVAFVCQGWGWEYFTSPGNFVDMVRIMVDGYVLVFMTLYGRNMAAAVESPFFSIALSAAAFYKWIKIMYTFTQFRFFGLSVLPILQTLLGVGPFFFVMVFHLLGIVHAYFSLMVSAESPIESFTIVFHAAMTGEYDPQDHVTNHPRYDLVRVLFAAVVLCFTVTLMNTFIAALSTCFDMANARMETVFQMRRAEAILSHMAVHTTIHSAMEALLQRLPCKSMRASLRRTIKVPASSHLWFCCAASESSS